MQADGYGVFNRNINVLHQKEEIRQAEEAAAKPNYFGKETR